MYKSGQSLLCLLAWLLACYPATSEEFLPKEHPKHQTIQKILDDLVWAIGDGRTKPTLHLLPKGKESDMKVAWYEPRQNQVIIEERTYDLLCEKKTPEALDALAFLLGHELAHYYRDHGWVGDFRHAFVDAATAQKLQALAPGQFGSIQRILNQKELADIEIQADYFGGLYGYLAGYNTLEVAPAVLEKIYLAYNINQAALEYPSLSERRQTAQNSVAALRQLIPIFEAGKVLLLLKQYKEAARCFDYIARSFPSREILNNAGIARALEAVDLIAPGHFTYAYPFEIDAKTRLSIGTKAAAYPAGHSTEEQDESITSLLQEAKERLEKARQKDPNYATTYVNLACVADLQKEYAEALFFAEKGLEIAQRTGSRASWANAKIVRGIIRSHQSPPDEAGALDDFETAKQYNSQLATLNLDRNQITSLPLQRAKGKTALGKEKIGNLLIGEGDQIIETPNTTVFLPPTDLFPPAQIYHKRGPGWDGLALTFGYSTFFLLQAREDYIEKSDRGIQIGSPWAQVVQAYGQPTYVVPSRQGGFHVYQQHQLIFQRGAAGKIRGWMVYNIED